MTYVPGDCAVGVAKETTWGTYAAVSRFHESVSEKLEADKKTIQSAGLRAGSRLPRSERRIVASRDVKGDLECEAQSKGMGLLFEAAFGFGASTLVAGATFQQVFRFGDTPPSLSIQKTIPQTNGTVLSPFTFTGCMVDSFEMSADEGAIVKTKFGIIGKSAATVTPAEAISYVAAPNLFHFAQGSISVGGALTAPTDTALASMSAPVAATVTKFDFSFDNNLAVRRAFGTGGAMLHPILGKRAAKGKMTIEFDSMSFVDAYLADAPMSILLEFDTGVALSTGTERLQVAIPCVKLNGEIPKANAGNIIEMNVDFDILDGLAAAYPLYLALRTSDTAL